MCIRDSCKAICRKYTHKLWLTFITYKSVSYTHLLGAGLAGIMFFWVCGKKYVETQVNTGRDKKFTDKFYPICKYIFCPVCFLVLILGIVLGGIG